MLTLLGTASTVGFMMSAVFVVYLSVLIVPYLTAKPDPPGNPDDFQWHFFVPCRDEEAVIGASLDALRSEFPAAHVWVADDASTDATAKIVQARSNRDPRVHLIQRKLPHARTGKSDALNALYQALDDWLPAGADHSRVIVGVVDADGRLRSDCLAAVSGSKRFGDARVAAVQIGVRMINRVSRNPLNRPVSRVRATFARILVRLQDLEFQGPITAIQLARTHSRTVSLGGNGQFTRLSGLDTIAGDLRRPWHGSLLEDFELGLHLLIKGFRIVHVHETWVDQEGLPHLDRLVVQRVRWGQGGMACMKYLPRVWSSPNLTNLGALEVTYFLLQPWLQLLGTVVYSVPLLLLAFVALMAPEHLHGLAATSWLGWAAMVAIGIGQFAVWGPLYRIKAEKQASMWQAAGWGLAQVGYAYLYYVIAWRAFFRLVRGQRGWSKTRRNAEQRVATVAVED